MTPRRVGPGIAKVRHPRPHATRVARLIRADDALWSRLFEHADVLSEGTAEQENGELVYRGSTSIILSTEPLGHSGSGIVESLADAASADPHLRLRAVRLARQEAQVRAPGALHPARMDVVVRRDPRGVRIDVDVDAVVEAPALGIDRDA